jgi:predicted O-methyltransferase YrrM
MIDILNKILNVSCEELNALNVNFINQYNFHHNVGYYFGQSANQEHYRLLMYIAGLFNNEALFDIGTYRCVSAAALSYNFKNKIISYDINQYLPVNPMLPRVEYRIGDCTKDLQLIDSHFMFFDVAHDGIFEKIFIDHLRAISWKGLLLCDDIHLEGAMSDWWNDEVVEEKYDITSIGHWSGTGLIYFK